MTKKKMVKSDIKDVVQIPIKDIEPNRFRNFEINPITEERKAEIRPSIEKDGLYQPAVVRQHPDKKGKYEAIFMHTRLEIAKDMGATHVPCLIVDADDQKSLSMMSSENSIQRHRVEATQDSYSAYCLRLASFLLSTDTYDEATKRSDELGLSKDQFEMVFDNEDAYHLTMSTLRSGMLPPWRLMAKFCSGILNTGQCQNSNAALKSTGLEGGIVSRALTEAMKSEHFKKHKESRGEMPFADMEKSEKEKEEAEKQLVEAFQAKTEHGQVVYSSETSAEEKEAAAKALKEAEANEKKALKAKKVAERKIKEFKNSQDHFIKPELVLDAARNQAKNPNIIFVNPKVLSLLSNEGQVKAVISAFSKDKKGSDRSQRVIPLDEQPQIVKDIIQKNEGQVTASILKKEIAAVIRDRKKEVREQEIDKLSGDALKKYEEKQNRAEIRSGLNGIVQAINRLDAEMRKLSLAMPEDRFDVNNWVNVKVKLNGDEVEHFGYVTDMLGAIAERTPDFIGLFNKIGDAVTSAEIEAEKE